MTIMEFELADKMEQINFATNAPKYLFSYFLSKNVVAGFVLWHF